MPKRYQCDYCQKSFQDTPAARRRHLNGAGHQRNLRLHYESFSISRAPRAEILYSELSGEEILQQWLRSHPEVLARYEEQKRTKKAVQRQTDRGASSSQSLETHGQEDDVPVYLEPYRAVLPPSLMPSSARAAFPHFLLPDQTPGWG